MAYKSKRSKATDISAKVKKAVYERDNGMCIYCGRIGIPNAHYISRAKGGLGIEQNIVTLCIGCHHQYDNGELHEEIGAYIKKYLRAKYPDWNELDLIYKKWQDINN